MKSSALAVLFACATCTSSAQDYWQSTGGPTGGTVRALLASSPYLFAAGNGVYRATSSVQWTNLQGPGAICLASTGSAIYAGTNNSGLYRSTDAGMSWQRITAYLSTAMLSVASRGDSLYAGIYGGIRYSTNGGTSWTTFTFNPYREVQAIGFDGPLIYAGTDDGVMSSSDRGTSWELRGWGVGAFTRIQSITMNDFYIFLGTTQGVHRVFRADTSQSLDGLTSETINAFVVSGDTVIAASQSGRVYRSTSSGLAWETGVTVADGVPILCMSNWGGILFAGTENKGVYRSTDWGLTWSAANGRLSNSNILDVVVRGSRLYATTPTGVVYSGDQGMSWVHVIGDVPFIMGPIATSSAGLFVAGATDVYRSNSGGASWTPLGASSYVLALGAKGQYILASDGPSVYRSTDGGDSWNPVSTGLPSGEYVNCFAVRGTEFLAGTGKGVYISNDNGATWNILGTGLSSLNVNHVHVAGTTAYVIANNGFGPMLYRLRQGESTWIGRGAALDSAGWKPDILMTALGSRGSDVVMASYDYVIPRVQTYRSTDDGETWQNAPGIGTQVMAFATDGVVLYAGTNGSGVFRNPGATGAITTASRTGIDLPIIDNGPGLTDTLILDLSSGLEKGALTGTANVTLLIQELTHPDVGELRLVLEHGGIQAEVISQGAASGENFLGTSLTGYATELLADAAAPYTGSFQPSSPLSVFTGLDPAGAWLLHVQDMVSGNSGTLNSWALTLNFDPPTAVAEIGEIPSGFSLSQNYPNPFNPTTTIEFAVAKSTRVSLKLYNAIGQEVTTLVSSDMKTGRYSIQWNAAGMPSGVYYCRLIAGDFVQVRKLVLLK